MSEAREAVGTRIGKALSMLRADLDKMRTTQRTEMFIAAQEDALRRIGDLEELLAEGIAHPQVPRRVALLVAETGRMYAAHGWPFSSSEDVVKHHEKFVREEHEAACAASTAPHEGSE